MLTCRDATARASEYVDGQLGLRERVAQRVHLLLCHHCRRFHRQLRALLRSLRGRRIDAPVSEAFVARVVDRLDAVARE